MIEVDVLIEKLYEVCLFSFWTEAFETEKTLYFIQRMAWKALQQTFLFHWKELFVQIKI